ncbi:MAG: hypothetical protein L0Z62_32710 [Gemmataceae bacterium]|nr:hypothetical protein [Gemmataceae bacterium]
MSSWLSALQRSCDPNDHAAMDAWFTRIADRLLNGCRLLIGKEAHRFVEVEFYYFGEGHPDPFTHREELQLECGRWYFHRTRGEYRGGSFKGVDLTFGDGKAFGGVLIRGIESGNGTLIDGPSLWVDHLLDRTGAADVATLDKAIGSRKAWEAGNPLLLEEGSPSEARTLYRSARVGLSLKRSRKAPEPPRYVLRTYRFFTQPRRIAKGKLHMVLALHVQGHSPEAIQQLTGGTKAAIARYIADFEEGRKAADFDPFYGIDLGPKELARLHGVWHAKHGPGK